MSNYCDNYVGCCGIDDISKLEEFIEKQYQEEEEEKKRLEESFNRGVEAGRKQVMEHIRHQCSIGKPIQCDDGELYWLTDAKQHLIDVMDSFDKENGI